MGITLIQTFTALPVALTDVQPNDVLLIAQHNTVGSSPGADAFALDGTPCTIVNSVVGLLYPFNANGSVAATMIDGFTGGAHTLTVTTIGFDADIIHGVVLRGVIGSDGTTPMGVSFAATDASEGDMYELFDGVLNYTHFPTTVLVADGGTAYVIGGIYYHNDHPVEGTLVTSLSTYQVYERTYGTSDTNHVYIYDTEVLTESFEITGMVDGVLPPEPEEGDGYDAMIGMDYIVLYDILPDEIFENNGPAIAGAGSNSNNNGSDGPDPIDDISTPVIVKDNAARLLVVMVSGVAGAGSEVASVVCNGVNLTRAGNQIDGDGVTFVEAWYTSTVPVYGEYTVLATFVDSVAYAVIGAIVFYGMDVGTPVYGWLSNEGVGAAHTLEYDLTDFRLIVDVLSAQGASPVHVNPTITAEVPYWVTPAGSTPDMYGAASYKPNSKSGAMYWLSDVADPRRYAHGILVLNRNLYSDTPPEPINKDDPADPEIPYEPPPDGSDDPRNPDVEPPNAQSCAIIGNQFLACVGNGVQAYWVNQVEIAGNTLNTLGGTAVLVEYVVNAAIIDNFMQGNQGNGIVAHGLRDAAIKNNTLQDCALSGIIEQFYPMYLNGCENVSVLGNKVFNYNIIHDYSIYINRFCSDIVVMNNDLTHSFLVSRFEDHSPNSYKENNAPEEDFLERVQDAVGNTTVDSFTIQVVYRDNENDISYEVIPGTVDADTVDGEHATAFADAEHLHTLEALSDVEIGTQTDGQALVWDELTSTWIPGTVATSLALWELTDVSDIDATDAQVLAWNDSTNIWEPTTIDTTGAVAWDDVTDKPTTFPPSTHTHALDELSDVDAAAPADGQVLVWNDTAGAWEAGDITAAPGEGPAVFTATIGNASSTEYNVAHNLGTTDVIVQVFETGGGKYLAYPAVQVIDSNNIEVEFTSAPALNSYRVIITAASVGAPDGYNVSWDDVTDKPTVFTPDTHTHPQIVTITLGFSGTLTTGAKPVRVHAPSALTITNITATVNTAPTGAAILVDVNKNGTTLFTTQGNRPQIAIAGNDDLSSTPDITSIALNDVLTFDIDQIGSTVAGADLVVQIRCTT